jgi:hypothetical protein
MGRSEPVKQQTQLNAPYVRLKGNAILRQKSRGGYRPASLPACALCFRQRRELPGLMTDLDNYYQARYLHNHRWEAL